MDIQSSEFNHVYKSDNDACMGCEATPRHGSVFGYFIIHKAAMHMTFLCITSLIKQNAPHAMFNSVNLPCGTLNWNDSWKSGLSLGLTFVLCLDFFVGSSNSRT